MRVRTLRQATIEDEHVVVRGKKDRETVRHMVNYNDAIMYVPETNEEDMPEHLQDPPNLRESNCDDMKEDCEGKNLLELASPSDQFTAK